MATYSAHIRTAAAAAVTYSAACGAAYAQLRAASTGRLTLLELGIFNTTAVAAAVQIIRSSAIGTNSTTQVGNAEDPGDAASLANLDSAWSTLPTIGASTTGLRRTMIPATIGGGIIWVWPPGDFRISVSTGLVIVNPTGTGQILDLYLKWSE